MFTTILCLALFFGSMAYCLYVAREVDTEGMRGMMAWILTMIAGCMMGYSYRKKREEEGDD